MKKTYGKAAELTVAYRASDDSASLVFNDQSLPASGTSVLMVLLRGEEALMFTLPMPVQNGRFAASFPGKDLLSSLEASDTIKLVKGKQAVALVSLRNSRGAITATRTCAITQAGSRSSDPAASTAPIQ